MIQFVLETALSNACCLITWFVYDTTLIPNQENIDPNRSVLFPLLLKVYLQMKSKFQAGICLLVAIIHCATAWWTFLFQKNVWSDRSTLVKSCVCTNSTCEVCPCTCGVFWNCGVFHLLIFVWNAPKINPGVGPHNFVCSQNPSVNSFPVKITLAPPLSFLTILNTSLLW